MMSIRCLRLSLAVVGALLGVMGFAAVPALAAAPETPELRVEAINATDATFVGVLDPHGAAGETVMYKFFYNVGASCMGGHETVAMSGAGAEHEEHGEPVTGLTPGTEYSVCVSTEGFQGVAFSKAVQFKTTLPPETPVGEEVVAGSVTATTAMVKGELNPNNAGEPKGKNYWEYPTYYFFYKVFPLSAKPAEECEESEVGGEATGAKGEEVSSRTNRPGAERSVPGSVCRLAT